MYEVVDNNDKKANQGKQYQDQSHLPEPFRDVNSVVYPNYESGESANFEPSRQVYQKSGISEQ